jgi:hypothetical protein
MFFLAERYANEVHFYAALIELPESVIPTVHFHADEMLPWVHLSDRLPRE